MLFASRMSKSSNDSSSSLLSKQKQQEWKCRRKYYEIQVFTSIVPLYITCILLSKLFQQHQQYPTTSKESSWWSYFYAILSSSIGPIFFSTFQQDNTGSTNNSSSSSSISIVTGFQRDLYITLFVSILMGWIRIVLSSFSHHSTKNNNTTNSRNGTLLHVDDAHKEKKKNCVEAIVKEGTSQHMLRTNEMLKFQISPNDTMIPGTTTTSSSSTIRRSNTTVMFRLLYSMVSSIAAIWFFRSCDFWSKFVGGTNGQTIHCWDLKGGILLDKMIDLDYDQSHSKLRYFFILEISYHLQNFTFRTLSLLTCSGKKKTSSIVPILEDTLRIIALVVSFLFSSSRRLGAIGIFALNVSSIALNLLHICINTSSTTTTMIIGLYQFIVIPIFLYCRLFIMPFVVWYSIAFESKTWLIQLKHGFHSNGLSIALYTFANFVMFITTTLQLVYAHRLIHHPYIQKLKNNNNNNNQKMKKEN